MYYVPETVTSLAYEVADERYLVGEAEALATFFFMRDMKFLKIN